MQDAEVAGTRPRLTVLVHERDFSANTIAILDSQHDPVPADVYSCEISSMGLHISAQLG